MCKRLRIHKAYITAPSLPKIKTPQVKTPALKTDVSRINTSLSGMYRRVLLPMNNLVTQENKPKGKKPMGAGRGAKHYGKTSAMGQMADNAVKTVRQKKKERVPYKPVPQMHELKSLYDMRRY